jgi:hypothetical protein
MAELREAFNIFKIQQKNINLIDYFFTQRNLKENHEYLDQNMNRKNKEVNIIYNFLALNIPYPNINDNINFDIEIFGDSGYHYKGIITSFQGNIPNFMIPLKGDKKIFAHIQYTENDNNLKEFIGFIDVPKRFQSIDINLSNINSINIDDKNIKNPASETEQKKNLKKNKKIEIKNL